jgi:hypothetical protein
LYNELFEADLNATLDAVLTEIYPQLINAPPALPAGESNELANPVILDPEG